MTDMLVPVLRRFPARQSQIRRLALASPSFRSLCNDFAEASAVLQGHGAGGQNEAFRAEYRALLTDLAAEIEAVLMQADDRS